MLPGCSCAIRPLLVPLSNRAVTGASFVALPLGFGLRKWRNRHPGSPISLEGADMFFEAKMAVFEAMKPDIEALAPVERRKFAELCRRWSELAEAPVPTAESRPTRPSGVLLELSRGHRSEE